MPSKPEPPELKMSIRTPAKEPEKASPAAAAIGELELDLAPYAGSGTGSDPEIEIDRGPALEVAPPAEHGLTLELDDGPLGAQPVRPSTTRPFPAQTRPPAADTGPPATAPAAPRARTPSPHTVARTPTPLQQTLPALPPVLRPPAPAQLATQELPIGYSVSLAQTSGEPGPVDPNARTREIPPIQQLVEMPSTPSVTRDFSEKPTNQVPSRAFALDPYAGTARPFDPDVISQPTRDLGLRPPGAAVVTKRPPRPPTEDDETTTSRDREEITTTRSPPIRIEDPNASIDAQVAQILEAIEADAPANEPKDERTRRRISALLDRAAQWTRAGELARAVTAVDLALSEDPNSALAQKLVHRNRDTITAAFVGFLGDLNRAPMLARPLHELAHAPISPRAAFLLSRIDGTLSLDEILDVSGMPRLEAYRYLCQLLLRGILR